MKKRSKINTISNIFYCFKLLFSNCKSLFFMQAIIVPINIIITLCTVYLPKIVAEGVIGKKSFESVLINTVLVGFIALIMNAFIALIENQRGTASGRYSANLFLRKMKKCLYADYTDLESSEYRIMMGRADDALWGSSEGSKIEQMTSSVWKLLENVIAYFIFGLTLAKVNLWISVIITLAAVVNYYNVKWILAYQYKNKDRTSYLDKKLWYLIHIMGDVSNAKDIRIYSLSSWLKSKYHRTAKERLSWERKFSTKYYIAGLMEAAFVLLRDSFAYIILIKSFLAGTISLDVFILCFSMVSSLASWIGGILSTINSFNDISYNVNDYRKFMTYSSKKSDVKEIEQKNKNRSDIIFDHVSFSFEEGGRDVIQNLSLHIHEGEKIALVGNNGAGKTTFVKLLCGLYTPKSGSISVLGKKVGEDVDQYFKNFSVVFQDMHFLPISVDEFVSGKMNPSYEEEQLVMRCIHMAGMKEKIDSLQDGINTKIGRQIYVDGVEFSGGEQQKLLLARAIYKDAPILILDEPTSALDPIAENNMYQNYNNLCKNKTSIFISHRLTSTLFCDRIIYLENGQILEQGTFEELMSLNGKYAKMYHLQESYYSERGEIDDKEVFE